MKQFHHSQPLYHQLAEEEQLAEEDLFRPAEEEVAEEDSSQELYTLVEV